MKRYLCMPRARIVRGPYAISAVQPEDIEAIRQWRNAQIGVLRQTAPITPEQQEQYYAAQIWPAMEQARPHNILLSYFLGSELVGYGGLVHIAWEHRRAEVSFLVEPSRHANPVQYDRDFSSFLELIREVAFADLGLVRLVTETYADREDDTVSVLQRAGFRREGVLRQHILQGDRPVDSIVHGLLKTDFGAVLVTSASRKAPLIRAVRCAARKLDPAVRVIATDADPNAPARHVADDFLTLPPLADEHLPVIIDECRKRRIGVVIPTRDGELSFWARHAPALEKAGIYAVVSEPAVIERCLDKLAFAHRGIAEGMPCIAAGYSPDDIEADRYVVKERYGAGSRGIGLNLDREAAVAHARTLQQPVFQPFIAGDEISIDAWLDRGHRIKGLVLRRREVLYGSESQVTTTFRDAALEQQAARVLESLAPRGPVVMQALLDHNGRLQIIECNPRFGGASTAAIAAGLDPFFWSLSEVQGADLAACPFHRIPGEVRQVRLPADTYFYGSDF